MPCLTSPSASSSPSRAGRSSARRSSPTWRTPSSGRWAPAPAAPSSSTRRTAGYRRRPARRLPQAVPARLPGRLRRLTTTSSLSARWRSRSGSSGYPNSGKTTLFNALTRAGAEITAYASVSEKPNVGMATIADERLGRARRARRRAQGDPRGDPRRRRARHRSRSCSATSGRSTRSSPSSTASRTARRRTTTSRRSSSSCSSRTAITSSAATSASRRRRSPATRPRARRWRRSRSCSTTWTAAGRSPTGPASCRRRSTR